MSNPADKAKHRETLVEQYSHNLEEHGLLHLERVVVVSIDENSAQYVINWAVNNFIRPDKDLVVLVHVRVLDTPLQPYVYATGFVEEMAEERKAKSHELLKTYASQLWEKQIACKAISMIGEAKDEIIRKVNEIKADVLIMGSRKMGAIKRRFLGSVSDHCAHHAPCTVIIAKPRDMPKQEKRRSIFG